MKRPDMIWSCLLHLGANMWQDKNAPPQPDDIHKTKYTNVYWDDDLRFDRDTFRRVTEKLPELGINTVLIDVGDGVRYDSHPEIGVNGALTPDELRNEVRRLRALGLDPVPKLNFASSHDAWLGKYERMLSTDVYRDVVSDLIHEVCEIFEKPTYLHLGMDEETAQNQAAYGYSVVRAEALWWQDFYHMISCCERENARPWMWSDYFYNHKELFATKMPKTVLQSNGHYWALKGPKGDQGVNGYRYRAFFELEELGFDQVPVVTTWAMHNNAWQIGEHLAREGMKGIKGFMSAAWMLTYPINYYDILGDAARVGDVREHFGDCF